MHLRPDPAGSSEDRLLAGVVIVLTAGSGAAWAGLGTAAGLSDSGQFVQVAVTAVAAVVAFVAGLALLSYGWRHLRGPVDGRLPALAVPVGLLLALLLGLWNGWALVFVALYLPMLVLGVALLVVAWRVALRVGLETSRRALVVLGALAMVTGFIFDRFYSELGCEYDSGCRNPRALVAGLLCGAALWLLAWALPMLFRRMGRRSREG